MIYRLKVPVGEIQHEPFDASQLEFSNGFEAGKQTVLANLEEIDIDEVVRQWMKQEHIHMDVWTEQEFSDYLEGLK